MIEVGVYEVLIHTRFVEAAVIIQMHWAPTCPDWEQADGQAPHSAPPQNEWTIPQSLQVALRFLLCLDLWGILCVRNLASQRDQSNRITSARVSPVEGQCLWCSGWTSAVNSCWVWHHFSAVCRRWCDCEFRRCVECLHGALRLVWVNYKLFISWQWTEILKTYLLFSFCVVTSWCRIMQQWFSHL